MRARLVVRALCVQVLLAIAVSQVGDRLPEPAGRRSIDRPIHLSSSGLAVLAADPVRFAEGTKGGFRTAVAACLAQVAIASGNVDRQARCTPLAVNPTNLARTSTSPTAAQRVSPKRWLA